jgi:hypothetical protein
MAVLMFAKFVFTVAFLSRAHGLASPKRNLEVTVWGNVLSKETCKALHDAARAMGLGHSVFRTQEPHTLIERALDAILQEMNKPKDCHVEYWSRQEWRHIEAHADVDENLAKREADQSFLYPDRGHVLYLQVGSDVRGPTCLFFNATSGGDLLRRNSVEIVTVPAVCGRLLQFPGNALHAVPRPTDLWLLPFVKGAPQYEPEETWGRSVILFNMWLHNPPSDVPFRASTKCGLSQLNTTLYCNLFELWTHVQVTSPPKTSAGDDGEQASLNAKIWLLGDERR